MAVTGVNASSMNIRNITGQPDKHQAKTLSFIHKASSWGGTVVSVYPGEKLRSGAIQAIEKMPVVYWRFGQWPYRLTGGGPEHYDPEILRHAIRTSNAIALNAYDVLSDAGRTDGVRCGPESEPERLCFPWRETQIEVPCSSYGRWDAIIRRWATIRCFWRRIPHGCGELR